MVPPWGSGKPKVKDADGGRAGGRVLLRPRAAAGAKEGLRMPSRSASSRPASAAAPATENVGGVPLGRPPGAERYRSSACASRLSSSASRGTAAAGVAGPPGGHDDAALAVAPPALAAAVRGCGVLHIAVAGASWAEVIAGGAGRLAERGRASSVAVEGPPKRSSIEQPQP